MITLPYHFTFPFHSGSACTEAFVEWDWREIRARSKRRIHASSRSERATETRDAEGKGSKWVRVRNSYLPSGERSMTLYSRDSAREHINWHGKN